MRKEDTENRTHVKSVKGQITSCWNWSEI